MKGNSLSKQEISTAFSTGKFEMTYPYLAEDVIWKILGDKEIKGKLEVVANCMKTTEYFNAIQTVFAIEDVILTDNKVVVRGNGEFIRNGKSVHLIAACDVYECNRKGELEAVFSYCTPIK